MRVLFLINFAQEHRVFYSKVASELKRRNVDVEFAVESHYTDYIHPDAALGGRTRYFSDYLRKHFDRIDLPSELADANVWSAFFPDTDRLMHTRFGRRNDPKYYRSVVANLGHFFGELFDETPFDSIVYENVSNAFSYMAYEIGARRGARYIGFAASRMPGRLDVLDRAIARDSRLEPTFYAIRAGEQVVSAETRAYVTDYLNNIDSKVPDYIKSRNPLQMGIIARYARRGPFERVTRSLKYALLHRDDWFYAFQTADPFLVFPEQFAKEVWRHAKVRLLRRRLYRTDVDLAATFFVYPLQFHPESSASVDGVAFNDEWANIEQIARNLPFGVSLYVKDHKHAAGRQALAFYERVSRIPNVVLIDPDFDTKQLLRRARAVVCCTSTMGFEALLLGKPLFVLGRPFYEFVPGCVRINSFADAFSVFSRFESITVSRADIEAFLAAYFICSEVGSLDITTQYDDMNVVRWIADVVERKTREHVSMKAAGRLSGQVVDA